MNHFTVLTDNNPLTYVLTLAKLDATGQMLASALGQYSFDIYYRAGINNADADSLSRYPFVKEKTPDNIGKINNNKVKVICRTTVIPPYIEIIPCENLNILEATEDLTQPIAQVELRELRKSQR
jgi:hypothetical protein